MPRRPRHCVCPPDPLLLLCTRLLAARDLAPSRRLIVCQTCRRPGEPRCVLRPRDWVGARAGSRAPAPRLEQKSKLTWLVSGAAVRPSNCGSLVEGPGAIIGHPTLERLRTGRTTLRAISAYAGRAIFAMRVRSQRCAPSLAVRWCQTAITSNGATSMGVLNSLSRLSWLRTSRDGMTAMRSAA